MIDEKDYYSAEGHEELSRFEHLCLRVRNILAAIAAVLFLASVLPIEALHASHHTIQGIAYFFGAGAYIAELIEMSDEKKRASRHHRRKAFMPNIFGLLYIILGISHLFD